MPSPAKLAIDMLVASLLIVAVSYLLGSIPVGYLLVRNFRDQDIRTVGSGNIGATNVLRTGGKGLGGLTFLLDMLKGCLAVYIGGAIWTLFVTYAHAAPTFSFRDARALAALFAVIGHMFPVWLRFKGGKGVATGFGVFLVVAPLAALASIAVFAFVLLLSRYVSLASIFGSASFPVFAWFFVAGERSFFFLSVQIAVALLIIVKHYMNIQRLLNGTESRFGVKKTA